MTRRVDPALVEAARTMRLPAADIRTALAHLRGPVDRDEAIVMACADAVAWALEQQVEPQLTHGRHCPCYACQKQDWTDRKLAHCGMHGPSCPAVYAPMKAAYRPTGATG